VLFKILLEATVVTSAYNKEIYKLFTNTFKIKGLQEEIYNNELLRSLIFKFYLQKTFKKLTKTPKMSHYILINKVLGVLGRKGKTVLTEKLLCNSVKFAKKSSSTFLVRTDSTTLFNAGSSILSSAIFVKSKDLIASTRDSDDAQFKAVGVTHKKNAHIVIRTIISLLRDSSSDRFFHERVFRCFKDTSDRASSIPLRYQSLLLDHEHGYLGNLPNPLGL